MSKELETVYVDFGDISAQATIERLVELVGIEAVKSAIDEIAAQQSVHLTVLPVREIETVCPHCSLVFDVPVPEPHARKNPCVKSVT